MRRRIADRSRPFARRPHRVAGRALRVGIAAALAALLVTGSASAAFALWSASASGGSSVILGKLAGSLSGTDAMTTTFSSSVTSLTAPLTLTNAGSIAGTYSTSVAASQGSALASSIRVDAWQVAGTADCTGSAPVGSPSVSGTWASLPSLSGSLAPKASAVWCTRSTPAADAPASATTNPVVSLVFSAGSWTSAAVTGGFYLNTSAAAPPAAAPPATAPAVAQATCTPYDGDFHVTIGFDPSARPSDTYYGLVVAGTRINAAEQGYHPSFDLAGTDVSPQVAPDGPARIDVDVLDADGIPTGETVATGTVTFAESNAARTVVCGG